MTDENIFDTNDDMSFWEEPSEQTTEATDLETAIADATDDIAVEVIEAEPEPIRDFTVRYPTPDGGERVFQIEEADLHTMLALTQLVGSVGLRSEQVASTALKGLFGSIAKGKDFSVPATTMIYSLLSVLSPTDMAKLTVILLFGGSDAQQTEGKAWVKSLGPNGLKLSPLVEAMGYRIARSKDLADSIKSFGIVQWGLSSWMMSANEKKSTPSA